MTIALLLVSTLLLASGIYSRVQRVVVNTKNQEVITEKEVLGTKEETESFVEMQNILPSPIANIINEVEDYSPPSQQNNTNDFIYPGANIRSESGNFMVLDTTDNPQVVTDWYKEKIRSTGSNVTSFVTTATNGNIKNELEGAGTEMHVEVKIEKSAISDNVMVSVTFKAN